MEGYHTDQKDRLLDFLGRNTTRQFKIEEIVSALDGKVGKSTVYRLMRSLVEEGRVRRFELGRTIYYQYLSGASCDSHLHLKCTVCGRMQHLDCSVSTFLRRQILATNRFQLDDRLTLLFGLCADCREKSSETPERKSHA